MFGRGWVDCQSYDEDECLNSPAAKWLKVESQERFHLFSQDDGLVEGPCVEEQDKEDSLDAILDQEYGTPIDPPYGRTVLDPVLYLSAEAGDWPAVLPPSFQSEFDPVAVLPALSRPGRQASFEAGSGTEQPRRGEWTAEPAADNIHVVRYDKEHIKKPPCGPRVSASCVLGVAWASDSKTAKMPLAGSTSSQSSGAGRPALPFPRGPTYEIGKLNPILRPLQLSLRPPQLVPEAQNEPEAAATSTGGRREEKRERMIGRLTAAQRAEKVRKFAEKRKRRIWQKKVSYDCRRRVAERRLRIKGKFVGRDAAAALLGLEAAGLSQNELVQSFLQSHGHCSIISAAHKLKIHNAQTLFNPSLPPQTPSLELPTDALPARTGDDLGVSLTTVQTASLQPTFADNPDDKGKYSMVASLPVVAEPVFVCKRRKPEETPASHLKHHKS